MTWPYRVLGFRVRIRFVEMASGHVHIYSTHPSPRNERSRLTRTWTVPAMQAAHKVHLQKVDGASTTRQARKFRPKFGISLKFLVLSAIRERISTGISKKIGHKFKFFKKFINRIFRFSRSKFGGFSERSISGQGKIKKFG